MSLAEIVQSSGWKNFMSKLYGIGASVVIVGALFKIQHYPMAGLFLFVGLTVEAAIFFFSAFEPLHEEPDWSLVYPELAGVPDDEEEMALQAKRSASHHGGGGGGGGSAMLAKFDDMLANAEITPDVFESLGQGLKKLNKTTSNLEAMSDVSAATNEFAVKVKGASESLGKLDESTQNTAQIIANTGSSYSNMTESLTKIEAGGKSYEEQMAVMNKNLSALNAVYELQLKGANEQVKEAETLMKGVQGMLTDLKDSAVDAKKYREHIGQLNENLAALNTVYGNMLSAMNVK